MAKGLHFARLNEVTEEELPPDDTNTEYGGGLPSQRWYCTLTAFWIYCTNACPG